MRFTVFFCLVFRMVFAIKYSSRCLKELKFLILNADLMSSHSLVLVFLTLINWMKTLLLICWIWSIKNAKSISIASVFARCL
jgi:hypothetical protein